MCVAARLAMDIYTEKEYEVEGRRQQAKRIFWRGEQGMTRSNIEQR